MNSLLIWETHLQRSQCKRGPHQNPRALTESRKSRPPWKAPRLLVAPIENPCKKGELRLVNTKTNNKKLVRASLWGILFATYWKRIGWNFNENYHQRFERSSMVIARKMEKGFHKSKLINSNRMLKIASFVRRRLSWAIQQLYALFGFQRVGEGIWLRILKFCGCSLSNLFSSRGCLCMQLKPNSQLSNTQLKLKRISITCMEISAWIHFSHANCINEKGKLPAVISGPLRIPISYLHTIWEFPSVITFFSACHWRHCNQRRKREFTNVNL